MSATYPIYVLIIICVIFAVILVIDLVRRPKKADEEVGGKKEDIDENPESSGPPKVDYEEYFDLDNFTEESSVAFNSVKTDEIDSGFDNFRGVQIETVYASTDMPTLENMVEHEEVPHEKPDLQRVNTNVPELNNNVDIILEKLKKTYNESQLEEIRKLLINRPDLDANRIRIMIKKDRTPEEIREFAIRWT